MTKDKEGKVSEVAASDTSNDKNSSSSKTFTILLIGLGFNATTGVLVKVANFQPVTSAFLRGLIALIVLLPIGYYEVKKKHKLNKKGIWLGLLGGLFLGFDFIFSNYAIFYVGSGIAMVLLNIQVIMLPALYLIFDGRKPTKLYYILIPFMILGLAMTGGIFDSATVVEGAPDSIFGWHLATLGTLLGAASGICYGFYLYFTRKAGTDNPGLDLQPIVWATIAQLIPQGIALLINFSGKGFDITHGVLQNGSLPSNPETAFGDAINAMSWVYLVILGIGGQAMCTTFIQYGSVRLKPTIIAATLLLSPVAALFVGYIWVDEVPSALQLLGVAVVMVSVSLEGGLHKLIVEKIRGEKADPSQDSDHYRTG